MSSVKRILGAGIFFVLIFTACEQIPSHIIAPEQMETLLIDIHKAEAISDNLTQYASDREKERLRQSVFDRHHVTQAQFDTSLVWYSEHMTKYSQIYNNVTGRTQKFSPHPAWRLNRRMEQRPVLLVRTPSVPSCPTIQYPCRR